MSPQHRRGHQSSSGHGKQATRKPAQTQPSAQARPGVTKPAGSSQPAETTEPSPVAQPAQVAKAGARPATVPANRGAARPAGRVRPTVEADAPEPHRPGVKRRGLARMQRSSALRNVFEYVRAYIPLFLVFVAVFAGFWAWTSFGPHAPTPKENWVSLSDEWKPKYDADLVQIAAAGNDLEKLKAGYTALHDDLQKWMTALSAVTDWTDARATGDTNTIVPQAVSSFVAFGNDEVTTLAVMSSATSANDILERKDELLGYDLQFQQAYAQLNSYLLGQPISSAAPPTIAFPPGTFSPTPTPEPSATPTPVPSPTPTPAASPSAGASPAVSPAAS